MANAGAANWGRVGTLDERDFSAVPVTPILFCAPHPLDESPKKRSLSA
jgi:hypothetical protein